MTTTPSPDHTASTAPGDDELAELCQSSGDYLAKLIADGMLDHAGRPDRLPELLFPDADPALVRAVWDTALPVGVWVGKAMTRPRSTTEGMDRLRAALKEAGYQGMVRVAGRTVAHRPQPLCDTPTDLDLWHPADGETHTARPRNGE